MSFIGPLLADGFAGDLTTLRWLQVACGLPWREAARFCLVSPETYRRWRTDRRPNPTALRCCPVHRVRRARGGGWLSTITGEFWDAARLSWRDCLYSVNVAHELNSFSLDEATVVLA